MDENNELTATDIEALSAKEDKKLKLNRFYKWHDQSRGIKYSIKCNFDFDSEYISNQRIK
jgi:hypothetical protein